jgi:hypothetical protein
MAQYRIPVEETFSWQRPVISMVDAPPGSPAKGDRHIVGDTPTGVYVGHEDDIAWYDGSTWKFDTPLEGWCLYRKDLSRFDKFDGSVWEDLIEITAGYMLKYTYDSDDDGIVDAAETVDDGAGNVSSAVQVKDAVTKAHVHANKAILDAMQESFTTALKTSYDDAVTKAHVHSNKAILDAVEQAFTTALKANYDVAYSRRGSYDAELGAILMDI